MHIEIGRMKYLRSDFMSGCHDCFSCRVRNQRLGRWKAEGSTEETWTAERSVSGSPSIL
jgi:hypothetical protein